MKDLQIESLAIAFGKPLPISDACECQEGLQEAPESEEEEMRKLLLMSRKAMDHAFCKNGSSEIREELRLSLNRLEGFLMLPWDRYQNLKREMEWE